MHIIKAQEQHLSIIAPLFDQYRIFYKQDSDLQAATEFLRRRIENNESVIFIAFINNDVVGFVQLYHSFSSVSLQPIFILNDLYVAINHRTKGVGEALLNHSKAYCKKQNFKGLSLETAIDNPAQKLYERLGWEKDTACFHYFWTNH